jgi:hypothetical protein
VIELGIVTDLRPEPENAEKPIVVSPGDNVTEVRSIQLQNAKLPIVVIELGIVTDVRPEIRNASSPIVVSPGDNVTEVRY